MTAGGEPRHSGRLVEHGADSVKVVYVSKGRCGRDRQLAIYGFYTNEGRGPNTLGDGKKKKKCQKPGI